MKQVAVLKIFEVNIPDFYVFVGCGHLQHAETG